MVTCADVARQALDFSKATFDNAYFTVTTLQTVAEDALTSAADAVGWMPDEAKLIVRECVGLVRRTRRDFKDTLDRCHRAVHLMIDRTLDDEPAPLEELESSARPSRPHESAVVH